MGLNRLLIVKFLQKTRLNKISHKIYYSYFHGFKASHPPLLRAVETCLQKALELGITESGDYYEFGIFKGYTFWYAQHTAMQLGLQKMRFFGFDSFAGLPKVEGMDKTKHNEFYKGQYACPKETVRKNLNSKNVDWTKTFLIEGFFENSLTQETKMKYRMDKMAIALIDCDLYSSTTEVLNFIQDMLIDKTILIFDDWNCFNADNERGQRKAFRDFLDSHKQLRADEFISFGHYGQTFILRNFQSEL
jgi:hypothetical protein